MKKCVRKIWQRGLGYGNGYATKSFTNWRNRQGGGEVWGSFVVNVLVW